MNDENITKYKKLTAVKIIIPVLLVFIVIGIWHIKNYKKKNVSVNEKTSSVTSNNSKLKSAENPDFNLQVIDKLDLKRLKSYGLPIVIDFGAESCIPCKKMAPVLKELNSELKGKAIIKFVDVWKYNELAKDYPIKLIPTQILIDANGKPYTPKDLQSLEIKQYSSEKKGEHIFTTHEGGLTKEELLDILKEMGLKE